MKSYILQQCDKVRSGRIALQDFLIYSEVRGASGAEYTGSVPPHAQVAMDRARRDRRDAAEAGERIPYVVAHTRVGPKNRLVEMGRSGSGLRSGLGLGLGLGLGFPNPNPNPNPNLLIS